MGVIGEMFPGKKLTDESGEDGTGLPHAPQFALDLDKGVAVLPKAKPASNDAEQEG